VIGVIALILHFLTKLLCRTTKAHKLSTIAAKKSADQPKKRRNNHVSLSNATGAALNPGERGVNEAITQQPASFKHKTRRQSVQQGLHLVTDLQKHHSKQPVMGVIFGDLSYGSSSDSELDENPSSPKRSFVGEGLFDIELSDEEVEQEGCSVHDTAVSADFPQEEVIATRGPEFWGNVSDVSDDSDADEAREQYRAASAKDQPGALNRAPVGAALFDIELSYDEEEGAEARGVYDAATDAESVALAAAAAAAVRTYPAPVANYIPKNKMMKTHDPDFWVDISDDSDSERDDTFAEAAADADVFKLLVADKK